MKNNKIKSKLKMTKLNVARCQLETAVNMYFNDGDPVSIHTLVCASHEILSVLKKVRGLPPMAVSVEYIKEPYKKEVDAKFKEAKNFFKHGKSDPNSSIDFNPDVNDYLLLDACEAYEILTGEKILCFLVFKAWFNSKYPHILNVPESYEACLIRIGDCGNNKLRFYNRFMALKDVFKKNI